MTLVRNSTGQILPCCWDDCERNGHDEIRTVETHNGQPAVFVFCSEVHKSMHVNATSSYGSAASGSRGGLL